MANKKAPNPPANAQAEADKQAAEAKAAEEKAQQEAAEAAAAKEAAAKEAAEAKAAQDKADAEAAAADQVSGPRVADRKSVTTKNGIIGPGESISAGMLAGGQKAFDQLVKMKVIIK